MNRRTILKGGLVLAATAHTAAFAPVIVDPLLELIRAYKESFADFTENHPRDDDEGTDAYADATYAPHLANLYQWDGPAMTREGAIEALRLSVDDVGGVAGCDGADRMVRAALCYLESLPA